MGRDCAKEDSKHYLGFVLSDPRLRPRLLGPLYTPNPPWASSYRYPNMSRYKMSFSLMVDPNCLILLRRDELLKYLYSKTKIISFGRREVLRSRPNFRSFVYAR
ncbi:unnamed protein product [Microthlaspi erraticum]|uniref:Uncharacterized protein n=1 Tax=Microthlaspi erraticum TaxID=1685480 RepID=A0A6D2I0F6_9BRAS|nr:unnamed protein product [Microthlaspi erraticum]